LSADPSGDNYGVVLEAFDAAGRKLGEERREVPGAWLAGGMALVASSGTIEDSPPPAELIEDRKWKSAPKLLVPIAQTDNGLPRGGWVLPEVKTPGLRDPVVQVIEQASGEIIYTLRIKGDVFAPPVWREGLTVRITDPDQGYQSVLKDQRARRED
jgi:hypothetical protein